MRCRSRASCFRRVVPCAPSAHRLGLSAGSSRPDDGGLASLLLSSSSIEEDRVRISLRLVPSVDQKLDDLAHLRGLDRNTAISVAIAQDWVACFGLQARQEVR